MDKTKARRDNLKKLIYQRFEKGHIARASELLNKSPSYISRCLWDPEKKQSRNIGEDFAREIERAFNLEPYGLDSPIGTTAKETTESSYIESLLSKATPKSSRQIIRIAQAASEGRLTETDITLLSSIAERFEQPKIPNESAKNIRKKL